MTRKTLTARGLALLAMASLGCNGAGDEAPEVPPRVATQRKELTDKSPASLESGCVSAQQPRLIVAPSEDAPESAVRLEGKELNCGETYQLVVSGPDGTKTSESLVADPHGSVRSSHDIASPSEKHDARLYDSRGEEVAQLLYDFSNFRYGHLTWRAVGPRTAEFSLVNRFNRVHPGSGMDGLVVTGDTFQDTYYYASLCFGDDSCTSALTYRVTSYDAAQGWVMAEAVTSSQPQAQPGTGVTVVETESNDTFGTANSMQLGDDYSSTIDFPYDVDYVHFTLPTRTRIQISTVLQTLGDSYLYLYDGNGYYLVSDDDSGPGLASLIDITLDAGTYHVGAAAYGAGTGQQLVQLREMGIPPTGPLTHTYSWDGPFTASISSCCRVPYVINTSHTSYRLQTQVGFGSANSTPVSSLPPVVEAPTRTPDFSFQIPATDAEGDALTFRLAEVHESYLWDLPQGLTVSSTGLVSWNTMGTAPGQLWAVQVIIEERREGVLIGSSPVEFLLQITGDVGSPPSCVPPPQAHYTVLPGHTLEFTVGTQDPDAWDTVTLNASGLPWYASHQPNLPLQGPSGVSTTISYTPSSWEVGYVFWSYFMVTDSTGQMGQCVVTIEVLSTDNWPPVANAGSPQYVGEGTTVTLDGTGSSDREGGPLTYQWSVVSSTGPEVTLSSATSATPSFTASNQGNYTFLLTVTDSEGATASATVDVYVYNVAPEVSATGGQLDEGQEFISSGSFTDPGADSWTATVDYGDGTGIQPLALDHGTFTLRHRYLDNNSSYWGEMPYVVQIFVTDDSGAQGSRYVHVDVRNVAPVMTTYPSSLAADPGQPLRVPITFTDPGTDSWWAWVDYGDGYSDSVWISGQEFSFAHTYYGSGTYSLTVTLWDGDGGSQTVTIPVEIHNVAPIVSLHGGSGDEGITSFGYGSFEDPGSRWWENHTITVDYGDGTGTQPVSYSSWDKSFWLSHRYADSGTYLVTVTVTDGQGAVGTATTTMVVRNVAPWVYLPESWYGFTEGSEMELNGYFSDPGTQDTWTATVDYGDGTGAQPLEVNGSPITLRHVYADDGRYTVTLTVMDDDGGVGVATRQVYVYNATPTVSATGGTLDEGSTFTSSGSFTDPGADTWTARVNYGDGSGWQPLALNGKSFALEHVYANSGTYVVYIYVRDNDGAEGNTYVYATVRNVLPEVTATGGTVNEGSAFSSSVSIADPGNERWGASVDYGDGSYGDWYYYLDSKSFTLNHVYVESGTYTVTIRVWDDGGTVTTTTQVVVHNVAPTVTATGGTGNERAWIFLSASYTDPGAWDTAVAQVDYGDGSPVETITPWYWDRRFSMMHRYADNGTYQVRISVIDDEGAVGTTTVPVEVRNVAPAITTVVSCSPDEGAPCTMSGQFTDPGADSWTLTVNFGDGSAPQELSLGAGSSRTFAAAPHVYDDNGLYTVVLTLTDDDGGSATVTRQVQVRNVAPTVTASNDSPRYWGVPVSLLGTVTDPSQADTQAGFTALWTLGDGMTASGLTPAHAYAAPGTYSARLSVTDKNGGTNTVPAVTSVTIQKRPGAITCQDTTAMFGFPVALSAWFVDGLAGGLPGGKSLSFRLGDATGLGPATTDALGQASVQSPGELMPGSYPITVSVAEDSHYTAAEARCTLTVTQVAQGKITGGGLRLPNPSHGGFTVMREEGGPLQGELQFQNESTSFHASEMTALGISADERQAWFAGVDEDGRSFTAYVEDNGEPGADVFKLWIDGELQTGDDDGTLEGGNIQIH